MGHVVLWHEGWLLVSSSLLLRSPNKQEGTNASWPYVFLWSAGPSDTFDLCNIWHVVSCVKSWKNSCFVSKEGFDLNELVICLPNLWSRSDSTQEPWSLIVILSFIQFIKYIQWKNLDCSFALKGAWETPVRYMKCKTVNPLNPKWQPQPHLTQPPPSISSLTQYPHTTLCKWTNMLPFKNMPICLELLKDITGRLRGQPQREGLGSFGDDILRHTASFSCTMVPVAHL